MKSEILTGAVYHHRLEPVDHRFSYPLYFYALELDELSALDRAVPGFGYNRVRPVAIHDRDYLEPTATPIGDKLRDRLREAGVREPVARITLVTAARYLHYVFNPVSFYLAYGEDGHMVGALAEVNNTFGDRHLYVLPALRAEADGTYCAEQEKVFHVSPFNDMRGAYRFALRHDAGVLDIRVDMLREGRTVFRSRLTGRGIPVTGGNLLRTLGRHPLAAALTMPRIMAQAARLHFRKHLPVQPRPEPTHAQTIIRRPPSAIERGAREIVLRLLKRIEHGALRLVMPDGSTVVCGDPGDGPQVTLQIRRYRFFTRIVAAADIGFGEAYTEGDFDCEDVTCVVALLIDNREALANGALAASWLGRVANRARHLLRPNTRRLSRRNIHDHYDLSNDFFATFLDPTMMYSCARYDGAALTLEAAQHRKMQALIDMAAIAPHHHVLEIGSGWGAMAIAMAQTTGCRVTTITVSEEQLRLAQARVREAGMEDRVDVRFCDYRDVEGAFDRIVSVEMLEAVGKRFLPRFFTACERLLKPGGRLVLQVITMPDARYEAYCRSSDWIQKHIFPGGHLPSLGAMVAAAGGARLGVHALENIGPDYATTLRAWRTAFVANRARVEALGFDETFQRKWVYYLAYCEAGFDTRSLDVLQMTLKRVNDCDRDAQAVSEQPRT